MPVPDTVETILTRIETKLDVALKDISDHEDRIRKLERMLWVSAGAAIAGGGALGTLVSSLLQGIGAH